MTMLPGPGSAQPPAPEQPPLRTDVVRVPLRLPNTKPVVTMVILVVTIAVFALQMGFEQFTGRDYPALLGMKINEAIRAGEYWRLLTPMLLHGGVMHIAFNMYALYSLGRGLERLYGHTRFLSLYLVAALAGNTASFLLSRNPSLGASTAVFGLIAAQGVTLYLNRKLLGAQARSALGNILFLIVANLLMGFTMGGIDNFGHLGGLAGGAVYALAAGPLLAVEGFYPDLLLADRRSLPLALAVAIGEAVLILLIAFTGL